MTKTFAQLKAEYERDPDNFNALQFHDLAAFIKNAQHPVIEDRLLKWFWRTGRILRHFVGTQPQLWYVIYKTVEQRMYTLRAGIDRIPTSPYDNVIVWNFRPENRLTKRA